MTQPRIEAVVFDLGMVLASPGSLYDDTAALLGVDVSTLERRYWEDRERYDDGGTNEEYWGALLRDLGVEATPGLPDELALTDMRLWTRLRPDALRILEDTRAAADAGDLRSVAILSNSPHALATVIEEAPWRPLLDHVFVSAPMGVMKPDPEIYRRVTEALGVDPDEIAFVDDKQANVDGALAAGWRAHLWRDDADTRAWLVGLGVLS